MHTRNNSSEARPLIIQYQEHSNDTDQISKGIQCQCVIAQSINELIDLLKLHQTHTHLSSNILIVVQSGPDIDEFISMVRSFSKFTLSDKDIDFAVLVKEPISRLQLRSLKNLEIVGLVPDSSVYNHTETVKALQSLSTGTEYWPFSLIEQSANSSNKKNKDNQIKLTPRQSEILSLVCNRGISNKKIAQMLNISESTVKVHISAILKAYRVRNRTQLALFAQQT